MTGPATESGRHRGALQAAARIVGRIPPRAYAWTAATVAAVLLVLGTIQRFAQPHWHLANLDSEVGIGKWVAAGLLWVAAGAWMLVAATGREPSRWVWIWFPVLAWLAIDEGNAIHERIERWSGLDWQLLYLPVLAVAGMAGLMILRSRWDDPPIRTALVVGGIAWGASLLLELIQNWGGRPIEAAFYDPMMLIEEGAEMAGSIAFTAAALTLLHRRATRSGSPRSQ